MKPKETKDPEQSWFWSRHWQEEEKKVQDKLKKGKLNKVKDIDELFKELNKKS